MTGFLKALALVLFLCAGFVCCGEILTSVSGAGAGAGAGAGGGGGEVGVELGEVIFFGKGKCSTCHSFGERGSAVRCPNLGVFGDQFRAPIGVRAAERREDTSAVGYLVESLYDPDAFVVRGFSAGLMPAVNRPPIGLNDDEIASAILFLLAASDVDTTGEMVEEMRSVQVRFAGAGDDGDEPPAAISLPHGDAYSGRVAFVSIACVKCHRVDGVNLRLEGAIPPGGIGPDLTAIGGIQSREYLIESILDPNAVIVADPPGVERGGEGSYSGTDGWSKMPRFHTQMTLQQMLDIAEFLSTLTDEKANAERYP